jgi:hypothetical protein
VTALVNYLFFFVVKASSRIRYINIFSIVEGLWMTICRPRATGGEPGEPGEKIGVLNITSGTQKRRQKQARMIMSTMVRTKSAPVMIHPQT